MDTGNTQDAFSVLMNTNDASKSASQKSVFEKSDYESEKGESFGSVFEMVFGPLACTEESEKKSLIWEMGETDISGFNKGKNTGKFKIDSDRIIDDSFGKKMNFGKETNNKNSAELSELIEKSVFELSSKIKELQALSDGNGITGKNSAELSELIEKFVSELSSKTKELQALSDGNGITGKNSAELSELIEKSVSELSSKTKELQALSDGNGITGKNSAKLSELIEKSSKPMVSELSSTIKELHGTAENEDIAAKKLAVLFGKSIQGNDAHKKKRIPFDRKIRNHMISQNNHIKEDADHYSSLTGEKSGLNAVSENNSKFGSGLKFSFDLKNADFQNAQGVSLKSDTIINQSASSPQVHSAVQGEKDLAGQIYPSVVNMAMRGEKRLTLTLQPKDLGNLRIELQGEKDMMTLRFSAQSEEVKNIIEQSLPDLKQDLLKEGLILQRADVNVSDQGKGFHQADQNSDKRFRQSSKISRKKYKLS